MEAIGTRGLNGAAVSPLHGSDHVFGALCLETGHVAVTLLATGGVPWVGSTQTDCVDRLTPPTFLTKPREYQSGALQLRHDLPVNTV